MVPSALIGASGLRRGLYSFAASRLLQEAVDFYFASCGEVDSAVDDDGDDEARGIRSAIALAVLFRGINWRAEFGGVVGVESCWPVVRAIPGFGGEGPDDGVLVAVG